MSHKSLLRQTRANALRHHDALRARRLFLILRKPEENRYAERTEMIPVRDPASALTCIRGARARASAASGKLSAKFERNDVEKKNVRGRI